MAEQENTGFPIDPKLALLILAVLGGGVYVTSRALQSSRPSTGEARQGSALGDQVVPARLWEDPFEAVSSYRDRLRERVSGSASDPASTNAEATSQAFSTVDDVVHQIVRHGNVTGSKNLCITVLEVMLPGGSYAEDAEARHRGRYAVLSALGVAGYVPWDAEHLGYAEIP
jgi:hypothetical protein